MWYCVETPDLYVIVARAFGINPHKYDSLRMKERRLRQTLQKFLEVCVRSAFERFDDFFSTGWNISLTRPVEIGECILDPLKIMNLVISEQHFKN